MLETREPIPAPLLKRIREVGALCTLAGASADETIAAIEVVTREHGYGLARRTIPAKVKE